MTKLHQTIPHSLLAHGSLSCQYICPLSLEHQRKWALGLHPRAVTLGRLLTVFESQFLHMSNEDNSTYLLGSP